MMEVIITVSHALYLVNNFLENMGDRTALVSGTILLNLMTV